MVDVKRICRYLMITFGITWCCWWSLSILTNLNFLNASQGFFTLIHVLGGFGPAIAAIVVLPDRSPKGIFQYTFSARKGSILTTLLFCLMEALIIGVSSQETNPMLPWYAAPIVMLSATIVGGGNEELGWRGILQLELEKGLPFLWATMVTGTIWMIWHIPLWFVVGASQQNMNYGHYAVYGLILSFWLATIYRNTKSVVSCAVFHGFSNLLLSLFVIKINWILVVGLILGICFSGWMYFGGWNVHKKEEIQ